MKTSAKYLGLAAGP